jgi:hypothetical protein
LSSSSSSAEFGFLDDILEKNFICEVFALKAVAAGIRIVIPVMRLVPQMKRQAAQLPSKVRLGITAGAYGQK